MGIHRKKRLDRLHTEGSGYLNHYCSTPDKRAVLTWLSISVAGGSWMSKIFCRISNLEIGEEVA